MGIYDVDTVEYHDCLTKISAYPENQIISAILEETSKCTPDNVLSLSYIFDAFTDLSAIRSEILVKIKNTAEDSQNYCALVFLAAQVEEKIYDDPGMAEILIDQLMHGKREQYNAFINDIVEAAIVSSALNQKFAEEKEKKRRKQEQEQTWVKQNASKILRVKVSLAGTRPLVWRVIEVPATYTFWDLHVAIQDVMSWDGTQNHLFITGRRGSREKITIGLPPEVPDLISLLEPLDFFERDEVIGKWFIPRHPPFQYIYDSREHWVHDICLQKTLCKDETKTYPRCTSGCRTTPPAGCGGLKEYRKWIQRRNHAEEEVQEDEGDDEDMEDNLWDGFDLDAFTPLQVRFHDPKDV